MTVTDDLRIDQIVLLEQLGEPRGEAPGREPRRLDPSDQGKGDGAVLVHGIVPGEIRLPPHRDGQDVARADRIVLRRSSARPTPRPSNSPASASRSTLTRLTMRDIVRGGLGYRLPRALSTSGPCTRLAELPGGRPGRRDGYLTGRASARVVAEVRHAHVQDRVDRRRQRCRLSPGLVTPAGSAAGGCRSASCQPARRGRCSGRLACCG